MHFFFHCPCIFLAHTEVELTCCGWQQGSCDHPAGLPFHAQHTSRRDPAAARRPSHGTVLAELSPARYLGGRSEKRSFIPTSSFCWISFPHCKSSYSFIQICLNIILINSVTSLPNMFLYLSLPPGVKTPCVILVSSGRKWVEIIALQPLIHYTPGFQQHCAFFSNRIN